MRPTRVRLVSVSSVRLPELPNRRRDHEPHGNRPAVQRGRLETPLANGLHQGLAPPRVARRETGRPNHPVFSDDRFDRAGPRPSSSDLARRGRLDPVNHAGRRDRPAGLVLRDALIQLCQAGRVRRLGRRRGATGEGCRENADKNADCSWIAHTHLLNAGSKQRECHGEVRRYTAPPAIPTSLRVSACLGVSSTVSQRPDSTSVPLPSCEHRQAR